MYFVMWRLSKSSLLSLTEHTGDSVGFRLTICIWNLPLATWLMPGNVLVVRIQKQTSAPSQFNGKYKEINKLLLPKQKRASNQIKNIMEDFLEEVMLESDLEGEIKTSRQRGWGQVIPALGAAWG